MKKLIAISVSILCLFCVNAVAKEHAWVPDDKAVVTDCCIKPDILIKTAYLYTLNNEESRIKANELWHAALLTGECFSIRPLQVQVILRELHKVIPGLHPILKDVDGELWKVEVMEKGSSGDFEPTGVFVFIGIYEKEFSTANPENIWKFNKLIQGV